MSHRTWSIPATLAASALMLCGTLVFLAPANADSPGDAPASRAPAQKALPRSASVSITPTNAISLVVLGSYQAGVYSTERSAAEIVDYDPISHTLYVVNNYSYTLDILSIADPAAPALIASVPLSPAYGANPNSVAVRGGLVAVALENLTKTLPGKVVFFDRAGAYLNQVTAGALPDMVAFTPDGRHALVANEGEPDDDYTVDPEGSIGVIDLTGGVMSATIRLLGFSHFPTATLDPRIRLFGPNANPAQNLEPEYIAVAPDSSTAWVTLQENNAFGVIDLRAMTVTQLLALGYKDHSLPGNGLDGSDRDGAGNTPAIRIAEWPVWGMYQPDGVAAYRANGGLYLVTANEGDSRDYDAFGEEKRVSGLTLDPAAFPDAATLRGNAAIGRLNVTEAGNALSPTNSPDTDGDGDIDRLFAFGARSFSIWSMTGTLVFDSGDALERITAAQAPDWFNSDATGGLDTRSDNKGPEPETVAVGAINNRTYAFVGLERIGGVLAFDVTDPQAPTFAQWVNNRAYTTTLSPAAGDLGPEGLKFIPAADSPNGKPLLIVANEVSGSTTVFEIAVNTPFNLTLLHTNDFHSRVDQYQNSGAYCAPGTAGCIAGSARLKTAIDAVRGANDHVLLLDAGDQFQGTLYYNQYKSDILTRTMNALGYQAMAVGNHEFDSGPAELRRFVDGAAFPVLSANLDASQEPLLAGKIAPSAVVTVDGVPVGIVGLTTEDLPALSSPGPNVTVTAAFAAAQAEVNRLASRGVSHIVGLTHLGFDVDLSLGRAITGLDVIIGGHSHTFLTTPVTPTNGDAPAGPYPTVVTAPDGNPVLVATAYQWGRYLGRLNVTFSPTGSVSGYSGAPIFMGNAVAQDPAVLAIITPTYSVPLEALRNTIVATATAPMSLTAAAVQICRERECELGNLVAEAMLWRINATLPVTGRYEAAIQNGGGLRAPIDAGPVSVGEVIEVLPFGNTIATLELTGTHIITALENGLSRYRQSGNGRFPQVAGLRYVWSPDRPVGSRILSVDVRDALGQFQPISPTRVYRVVTNNFMRGGGDGYTVFQSGLDAYDFGPSLDEAAMDYLKTNTPYAPVIDGRIRAQRFYWLPMAMKP